MFHSIKRRIMIVGLLVATLIPLWGLASRWLSAETNDGSIALQAPPFVTVAHAQGGTSFADSEAGIAAYIRASSAINLSQVVPFYHTVEQQNENYILGSVGVTDYDDNHDVKVYIHRDGWVMAYYPRSEPTSRIFDWLHYDGSGNLPTKLEEVLTRIGTQIGAPAAAPSYYHFSHPNANRLMLVADNRTGEGSDSFQIEMPVSFEYSETSWSHYAHLDHGRSEFLLDGSLISSMSDIYGGKYINNGLLTASQLSSGIPHEILLRGISDARSISVGLAITYEVP